MKNKRPIIKIGSLLLFLCIFGSVLLFSLSEGNNNRGGILEDEIVDDSDKFLRDLKKSGTEIGITEVVSTESTVHSSSPTIVVDGAGNMHVVWEEATDYDNSGTDIDIFYKQWDAVTSTWTPTEVISTESTGSSSYPTIAVDCIGNVHVAWQDSTPYGGSGTDWDIFYKQWDAVSSTWTLTEVITTYGWGSSSAPAIAVDGVRNVHVVWSDPYPYGGSDTDWDIFYKRWDVASSTWTPIEVVSIESTGTSSYPTIAVDGTGNKHVVWEDATDYDNSGTDPDIFYKRWDPVSYPSTPAEVVSTESSSYSWEPTIAVDSTGNAHIAWQEHFSSAWEILYKQWDAVSSTWTLTEVVSTESSIAFRPTIAVDCIGNKHVAWDDGSNYACSGTDRDIFYKRWDSVSNAWTRTEVVSTESTEDSSSPSIAVDGTGNKHVVWEDSTDYGNSGTDNDIFYKRLSVPKRPEMLWTRQFGTDGEDEGWVVSVDSTGVYVAGHTNGILPDQTSAGYEDNFVRKYDHNGNEIWTQQFGEYGTNRITGSFIDSTGFYVTGVLGGSGFVRKYNTYDGNEIWTLSLNRIAFEISVDSSSVYVVGTYYSGGGEDVFVRKYDHAGIEVWTHEFGTISTDHGRAISVDSTGVYITGFTEGALPEQSHAGGKDTFVRKYEHDGTEGWTRQFGTLATDRPLDITTDSTGVYVVGWTEGTLPGQTSAGIADAYIRKYDHNGNEVWTHQFGTSQYDRISEVFTYSNDVYVAGQTHDTLPDQSSAGSVDCFVRKYKRCGNEIWTHQFGTEERDEAYGVAVDSTGAYVTGFTSGTLSGSSAGGRDAFLAKLVSKNTPTGVGIKVIPSPEVSLTFSEVTEVGYTYITSSTENPGSEMPGFQFLGTYYDITTTATYTGAVTISIAYDDTGMTLEEEEVLQLLHWNGTSWVDETTNIDTINNIIYASVSSFSWFGIAHYSNIPLTIESITGPLEPTKVGDSFQITGTFTNPDSSEAHSATFEWGNGEIFEVTIDPSSRTLAISHMYTIPGVYSITITVSNNQGESDTKVFEYVVVYDPEAGFVTGGGWIESPAGAYTADPDLSGKANFGFVAKYKKGATVPTGSTVFQFHAGDLNFHSDTYDWLIIAGAQGKFKGSGTINGEGSYKFMLTAVDGAINGGGGVDKFRLKIWVEDEETGEEIIIYDNKLGDEDDAELDGTTEIGGGSIMIHK